MSKFNHVTDCDSCGNISCCRESFGGTICYSCDNKNDAVQNVDQDHQNLANKGIEIPKHLLEQAAS